jgi:hypothetical protein
MIRSEQAKRHVETEHGDAVFKCSYPGCELTLVTERSLKGHVRARHPGWVSHATHDHACPAADMENCRQMFASQAMASRHANISHHSKIPCQYRKEFSCEALFENTQEEGVHKVQVHSRYTCNVPNCLHTPI